MKYYSHLNTAIQLIQQYRGKEPLHHFLKFFFSQHKKYGSRDRKRISHLCYLFYRVGRLFFPGSSHQVLDSTGIEKTILTALFFCNQEPDELLGAMKPEWDRSIVLSLPEKVKMANRENDGDSILQIENIFPWMELLSEGIDKNLFAISHLQQPDLFIRIRPGHQKTVLIKLQQQTVLYEYFPPASVQLPNGYKVDIFFEVDREVVIQDLSSQRIGEFLRRSTLQLLLSDTLKNSHISTNALYEPVGEGSLLSVWDCCAASGGKSIMVKDILGDIDLTVSDIRESILTNLERRFALAGLTNYRLLKADLSTANSRLPTTNYDLIIADLPCTGSGTWGRTPEQLYFFDPATIEKYSALQMKILANVIPQLKGTGKLLYTTCSVFKNENEDIVQYMQEQFQLKVEMMEVIKGYDQKADTMFSALLSRSE